MTGLDSTLARRLAGHSFRRADTHRDERGPEVAHAVERALHDAWGWVSLSTVSRRRVEELSGQVDGQAREFASLGDGDLNRRFREAVMALKANGHCRPGEVALSTALACVGLASKRVLGKWPHAVQFMGACQLLNGRLCEMRTGEGKTLVAAMAATMMAASGAAVHVVSTNDYLAQRDSEEMTPLFGFFGLSVGHVIAGMKAPERQQAYRRAICYVSAKELVFDYLKDRLAGHGQLPWRLTHLRNAWQSSQAQSEADPQALIPALHFAIVDEADSVLIDEASTPMILSREVPGLYESQLSQWAITSARSLIPDQHYRLTGSRAIDLLPGAVEACPDLPPGVRGVWKSRAWRETLLSQALSALHLFHRDQHYILAEGKVQIVDESTGRVMADRSWEQGLHQMIEAKEGLALTLARETLARMTFQRFFRRYYLLSGLTGTATEASRELWAVYRLRVTRIPPNRGDRRLVWPPLCLPDAASKWRAVVDEALRSARLGQAVLIGTRSVQASEQLSAHLDERGVGHMVLNARQDAHEAEVIAQAGQSGRITVATNMAGRGTDIKLDTDTLAAGGLYVILTEFHESPRVDRQLFGRCGRQGEPGAVRAIVSIDDALFKETSPSLLGRLCVTSGRQMRWMLNWAVQSAQWSAERRAYKRRMQTLQQDRDMSRLIGFAGPQ